MHSQQFIQKMKDRLLAEKKKLEQDLSNLSPHTEMGDEEDDQVDEIEVDEVNQDLIARMKQDLEKISSSLQKISDGNYGLDAEGKEISEDRLRAIPWADKGI